MKIIDRYILRQFIQTALFSLLAFMVIFVVVDMMENLDDFLDRSAGVGLIATYYMYFLPEIIKLMIPVAMLLSALFTTGRLSTFNELTTLKSGGMSLYRFMAPLLILALLVSGVSIYFNGWIVPFANKKKFELGRSYFQKNIEYVAKNNIYIQDSPVRILSIGMFEESRGVAHQVNEGGLHDGSAVGERGDVHRLVERSRQQGGLADAERDRVSERPAAGI